MPPKIEHLVVKYLCGEATDKELDTLSLWISKPGSQRVFEEYVRTHYEVTTSLNAPDTDRLRSTLVQRIRHDKRDHYTRLARYSLKYAAIVLLFLGLGYLYRQGYFDSNKHQAGILLPEEKAITLEMENGKVYTLRIEDNKMFRGDDGRVLAAQKDSQLVYSVPMSGRSVYNTIRVPYGKRFDVILSDGTHVYLNSGSSMKYPISFSKESDRREVFLSGEAYFDVSKNKEHPFRVCVGDMSVQVLGTIFNVSGYHEDAEIQTTLVEGSVEIQTDSSQTKPVILDPGHLAKWHKIKREVSVKKVDTRLYTSWLEGKLVFRNTRFKHIRQSLERKYNVTIKNNNTSLDQQYFDATFDVESIYDVLESFSKSYAIDYKIVNNEVIIK